MVMKAGKQTRSALHRANPSPHGTQLLVAVTAFRASRNCHLSTLLTCCEASESRKRCFHEDTCLYAGLRALLVARGRFRRPPARGEDRFTVMCLHANSQYAKRRSICINLLRSLMRHGKRCAVRRQHKERLLEVHGRYKQNLSWCMYDSELHEQVCNVIVAFH